MSSILNSADFRAAIAAHNADVQVRTGRPAYPPFVEQREALAAAVDGLDLGPAEWRTLAWFLDWDNIDTLASIITKARATGL